jgi:hypothetical protein
MKAIYRFLEGPLDGRTEQVNVPGVELNVWGDDPTNPGGRVHYRLAPPLPNNLGGKGLPVFRYRFVSKFDPDSSYMRDIAADDAAQVEAAGGTDLLAPDQ